MAEEIKKEKENFLSTESIDSTFGNTLPGEDVIIEASGKAKELMTGAIPEDVQAQLLRISGEKGIKSGLGQGEAARNLVARDLGQTSFDIMMKGVGMALETGDASLRYQALKEQRFEFQKKNELAMDELEINERKLSLMAHEMVLKNQQFGMSLANELIINNSRMAIEGVQDNVNSLIGSGDEGSFFEPTEQAILDLVSDYTGG